MWWIESNPKQEEAGTAIHLRQLDSNGFASSPAAEANEGTGIDPRTRPPTNKLTASQLFYLLVLQGLGALIIAGGLNFAVGYFLYSSPRPPPGPPPGSPPPFLFSLPISFLADALMTTFIQALITWFCSAISVNRDLVLGRVAPLRLSRSGSAESSSSASSSSSFPQSASPGGGGGGGGRRRRHVEDENPLTRLPSLYYLPPYSSSPFPGPYYGHSHNQHHLQEQQRHDRNNNNRHNKRGRKQNRASRPGPSNRFVRWFLFLDHYNAERGSAVLCGLGTRSRALRGVAWVLGGLGRGALVALAAFALMAGPTIGLLVAAGTPYKGDWVFLGRWDGAVFKLVYGGVLGLLLSPTLALMWMVRAGFIVGRGR